MTPRRPVEGVSEHFDDVADAFASAYQEDTASGAALRGRVQRVLALFDQPGGRVLDAGCGPAATASRLMALGCQVVGVDLAPAMLALARRRLPRLHVVVGDVLSPPFRAQPFDAVIAMGVIQYLADERVALAELTRLLRPGGSLILTCPNARSPYVWWRGHVYYPLRERARPLLDLVRGRQTPAPLATLQRGYTVTRITEWLEGLSCPVEIVTAYNFQVLPSPLDQLAGPLGGRLATAVERLAGGPAARVSRLAGGFALRARRR